MNFQHKNCKFRFVNLIVKGTDGQHLDQGKANLAVTLLL